MQNMHSEEQKIHDRVLEDSAKSYLKVTTIDNIFTNPSGAPNHPIDGKYPDVIIKLPSGEIILEEVETDSTLNKESLKKWQDLDSLGYELRLLVPLSKVEYAKILSANLANVNVQAYDATGEQIQWFGQNR